MLLLSSSGYGFSIIQITPPSPVYLWDITGTLKTAVDRLHALVPYFRTQVYKETVLLMIGGGSPPALKAVQNRIISSGKVSYFNSADHDTTRVNVAAGRGVCLAPGFLNDHSGQFAWTPFDCEESFSCVLCTHKNDARDSVREFLDILKELYREAVAFPL